MKKIYIENRHHLNKGILEKCEDIVIINDPKQADFIIATNTVLQLESLGKTILLISEAPRTTHRKWLHSNLDKFNLVICHHPDPKKSNQMSWTEDDSSQYFPYKSDVYVQKERKDTKFRDKGIFFAGNVQRNDKTTDEHGAYSINFLRHVMGDYFNEKIPQSKFIGIGWGKQTTKTNNWREEKMKDIEDSKCDFVLALENTIYPNYLTEKIWDGINSDRVTLYLGDPNVEKHIPLDCFIDLRPFYNVKTKKIDLEGIYNKITNMSQEEYDKILSNARKFRKTCTGKHLFYSKKLTQKIIEHIRIS
jgi:hypothetical protein